MVGIVKKNGITSIKKALAFTLAETLIVMGIIGVVAALTIPNLNSSTADKEKVAKLKKVYSNLNDAIGRVEATYGPLSENVGNFPDRLSDFLKVSKTCGYTANTGCFPSSTKLLDGSNLGYDDKSTSLYKYILADGTSLGIAGCTWGYQLFVDIDGPSKGASTLGKDVFDFHIVLPQYISDPGNALSFEDKGILLSDAPMDGGKKLIERTDLTNNFKTGQGLATWVIQNDNMDYLKATAGKCPNNKVLSWTNTSCK